MQTDDIIQNMFKTIKNVKWRDCEENEEYEWYYAESMHYIIHNKRTHAYWLVKAKSPSMAFDNMLTNIRRASSQ